MASVVYLDTHVVAWLYAFGEAKLPESALEPIRRADRLLISPMVRLELQYLYELGRVSIPPPSLSDTLRQSIGLEVCEADFAAVAGRAESLGWTRDPFDRLIVAQAALADAPLVTKDETIRAHYDRAVW